MNLCSQFAMLPETRAILVTPTMKQSRNAVFCAKAVRLATERRVLSENRESMTAFRCYFAMGKIRGTPCMRSHVSVHRATTKYFSNSFVYKTEIEKEGLPGDITPALGAGGPGFKSRCPDQPLPCLSANLNPFHCVRIPAVEPLPEGRSRGHGQLERTARP